MSFEFRRGAERQFTRKGIEVWINDGDAKRRMSVDATFRVVDEESMERIKSGETPDQDASKGFVVRCDSKAVRLLDESGAEITDEAERTDVLLRQPEIILALARRYREEMTADGKGVRRGN